MDALFNVFSAFGLSASAGLNAYLPLLIVALVARFSNLVTLHQPWDVLTSWWVIGALTVLLIIETFIDKIPAVDTLNNIVQTVGRPTAGAILFASQSGVVGEVSPVVACIAGLLVAGTVHTAKTVSRPAITAATGGAGNWVVSLLEDVLVVIGVIVSIILPILMAVLVTMFIFLFGFWWTRRQMKVTV